MSSTATSQELQAGALNAWTPLQQAALYQQYIAEQHEKDVVAKAKEDEAEAKKESKRAKGEEVDPPQPDKVEAGKIIDELIKRWCPPLYDFLDIFAPPHQSVVPFVLLHLGFWYSVPWYFRFLLPHLMLYGIPIYMTLRSMYNRKDRALWQAWWIELALVEYIECVFFQDTARSLVWWRNVKAVLFIALFSIVEVKDTVDRATRKTVAEPVYGALKVIERWLPELEDEKKEREEKAKKEKEDKAKKEKEEKERAKSNDKDNSRDKDKDRDKGRGKDKDKEKEKDKSRSK